MRCWSATRRTPVGFAGRRKVAGRRLGAGAGSGPGSLGLEVFLSGLLEEKGNKWENWKMGKGKKSELVEMDKRNNRGFLVFFYLFRIY